jgi:hypothetical protein
MNGEYGEWAVQVRTRVITAAGASVISEHVRHERGTRSGAEYTVRRRERTTLRQDNPGAQGLEITILGMELEIPE